MLLSIIIVSYNTKDLTIQTLASVIQDINNSPKLKNQTEIIVVDNHSSDDSVSAIKNFFQQHKIAHQLFFNKENLGFAKANNQAIKKSSAEFVLLLNSDTQLKVDCLKNLLATFKQVEDDPTSAVLASAGQKLDKLGIVAADLLNVDGSAQPQGGSFPNLLSTFIQMSFLDDIPLIGQFLPSNQHTGLNQQANVKNQTLIIKDWVGGTAMLLSKKMLQEIALLDENIFMYGEDMELCMRAKAHHFDIVINPQAQVVHYGSASSSSKQALLGELQTLEYIWQKHKPAWQLPILRTILQLGCLARVLLFSLLNQQDKVKTYTQAFKNIGTSAVRRVTLS